MQRSRQIFAPNTTTVLWDETIIEWGMSDDRLFFFFSIPVPERVISQCRNRESLEIALINHIFTDKSSNLSIAEVEKGIGIQREKVLEYQEKK